MSVSDKSPNKKKKADHLNVVEGDFYNKKDQKKITKPEQVSIDIGKIDVHDLDINFGELGVDPDTESKILSINPLNPFSNQVELDLNRLNSEGYITPKHADTLLSNTFRMIKRPVINNSTGKSASIVDFANMIMVTSSVPGEGKTFCAINLAISIALEKNTHVLLVDADINKPSHHEIFGLKNTRGLTDLLMDKVDDMSDVLYKTNIPTLSLLSAGSEYAHATELLASADMDSFVKDVSERYPDRIVIFDSPPLLLTTESSVLASHMGQIILVVEAEKTLPQQIKKSLGLLQNEIILLMLNKMREKNEIGGYGYYGYGYGNKSKE